MRFQADEIGQFVDAFLADHGGIHVGQQKLLAPGGPRLHHDVDRQIATRLAQAGRGRGGVPRCLRREYQPRPRRTAIAPAPAREEWRARRPRPCYRARGRRDCRSAWRRETFDVGSRGDNSKAVLIAGPTASGKSALALELARATGGVIVNADSMQVYRDLRIITARPTPEEEALNPHRLYGHVDAAVNFSAGHWVSDAANALAQARAQRALPIFVGGSGLYFKALTRGLSAVPPIAPEIREGVRARLDRDGVAGVPAGIVRR